MAQRKIHESGHEIKSNAYLIECIDKSHKKPFQFEKKIAGDRQLRDIGGCIYETFKYKRKGKVKNLRIGFVRCNGKRCHSSSHLRIVKKVE